MINSIVFDMDGVLFDSEQIYYRAWAEAARKIKLSDIDACVTHCVGRNSRDIREYLLGKYGQAFQADAFIEDIRSEFSGIVAADGLPVKEGAGQLLTWLTEKQWRIALATSSGEKGTRRNLANSGFDCYFKVIVTGNMIERGKPAPDIYLLACSRLGSAPEDCFAVEDSPNGVRSAHAAGLRVILVPDMIEPTAEIARLAHKTFQSLVEVRAYLENLSGNAPSSPVLNLISANLTISL